jgi:hypothetical protein
MTFSVINAVRVPGAIAPFLSPEVILMHEDGSVLGAGLLLEPLSWD